MTPCLDLRFDLRFDLLPAEQQRLFGAQHGFLTCHWLLSMYWQVPRFSVQYKTLWKTQ